MSRKPIKPYLIVKQDEGLFGVEIRTTRLNSQGYPLVSSEKLDQSFASAFKARSFLREQYDAGPADIALG